MPGRAVWSSIRCTRARRTAARLTGSCAAGAVSAWPKSSLSTRPRLPGCLGCGLRGGCRRTLRPPRTSARARRSRPPRLPRA
eukprot:8901530-Alexandrium_andersonii.AAC.1